MDMRTIMLQMIDLQKASFDNGYEAIVTVQDQTEKAANTLMGQAAWLPSESRGVLKEWFGMLKKGREDFKKVFDEGYDHIGGYINSASGSSLR